MITTTPAPGPCNENSPEAVLRKAITRSRSGRRDLPDVTTGEFESCLRTSRLYSENDIATILQCTEGNRRMPPKAKTRIYGAVAAGIVAIQNADANDSVKAGLAATLVRCLVQTTEMAKAKVERTLYCMEDIANARSQPREIRDRFHKTFKIKPIPFECLTATSARSAAEKTEAVAVRFADTGIPTEAAAKELLITAMKEDIGETQYAKLVAAYPRQMNRLDSIMAMAAVIIAAGYQQNFAQIVQQIIDYPTNNPHLTSPGYALDSAVALLGIVTSAEVKGALDSLSEGIYMPSAVNQSHAARTSRSRDEQRKHVERRRDGSSDPLEEDESPL